MVKTATDSYADFAGLPVGQIEVDQIFLACLGRGFFCAMKMNMQTFLWQFVIVILNERKKE